MSNHLLSCSNLYKQYHDGENELVVLKGINFILNRGETAAIMGASGSGKSTFLHLLAGIDSVSAGEVTLNGQRLDHLSDLQLAKVRNQELGFIYQFHHLLPEMTALDNVAMPLLIAKVPYHQACEMASQALHWVGLSQRAHHKPSQLSGGERQRVAIARAVVHEPSAVLADEPTGNLDRASADEILDLLLTLNQDLGMALLIVTHDQQIATRLQSHYRIENGELCPNNGE